MNCFLAENIPAESYTGHDEEYYLDMELDFCLIKEFCTDGIEDKWWSPALWGIMVPYYLVV